MSLVGVPGNFRGDDVRPELSTFVLSYTRQIGNGEDANANVEINCGHRWSYNSLTDGGAFAITGILARDVSMRILITTYDYSGVQQRRLLYWLEDNRFDLLTVDGNDARISPMYSFHSRDDDEIRRATTLANDRIFSMLDNEIHLTIDSSDHQHVLQIYNRFGGRIMDVIVSDLGTFNGPIPNDADHYMFKFARDTIRELGKYKSTVTIEIVDDNHFEHNVECVLDTKVFDVPPVIHGEIFYGPFDVTGLHSYAGPPSLSIIVSNHPSNGSQSKVEEILKVSRDIYIENKARSYADELGDRYMSNYVPHDDGNVELDDLQLIQPLEEVSRTPSPTAVEVNTLARRSSASQSIGDIDKNDIDNLPPVYMCGAGLSSNACAVPSTRQTLGLVIKSKRNEQPQNSSSFDKIHKNRESTTNIAEDIEREPAYLKRIRSHVDDNEDLAPSKRMRPTTADVDNAQPTITVDDLKDVSKLTMVRMKAYLKKNTNLYGVTRYDREKLVNVTRRTVLDAARQKNKSETTDASNVSPRVLPQHIRCMDESQNYFVIKVMSKLVDCSTTRQHPLRAISKYRAELEGVADNIKKPEFRCRMCKKDGMWKNVTYGNCGHSVICWQCDRATVGALAGDVVKRCLACQEVVTSTYSYRTFMF
ncbi:hypothetical protein [Heliothis virescens ascovirus 3h]|uniref:Uncharacterized protein n=1 Tax=Heliothis virescens ascovirus 3h TaxID=1268039 RepID=A0A386JAA3_9VIRU|nr:hypothetical protein [Heliothis virescens ascovirus 3h]